MGTRFRAYQLGEAGSSFSYCHDGNFTLIEARITEMSCDSLVKEIHEHAGGRCSTLHITSWDKDHCDPTDLELIIKYIKPNRIEAPGYPAPDTDSAKESFKLITRFNAIGGKTRAWTPSEINSLEHAAQKSPKDVLFWPLNISEKCNDNSTAKIFRAGHFSVLSLGDLEDSNIADRIASSYIAREADVMILAHHGADNGFTTKKFLDAIRPRVAVSTSDYNNQYDHPRQEIRDLLYYLNIDIYTTKTGDILIESIPSNPHVFKVINYKANSQEISSTKNFSPKFTLAQGTYKIE